MLEKGLSISSVQRTFGVVRAVTNFAIAELGLGIQNNFIGIYLPTTHLGEKRRPIPTDKLVKLQKQCLVMDDDIRWLVALISDTGMRLAEAAGLLVEDIKASSVEAVNNSMNGCWSAEPNASPCSIKRLPFTCGPTRGFLASPVSKGWLRLLCQKSIPETLSETTSAHVS